MSTTNKQDIENKQTYVFKGTNVAYDEANYEAEQSGYINPEDEEYLQ